MRETNETIDATSFVLNQPIPSATILFLDNLERNGFDELIRKCAQKMQAKNPSLKNFACIWPEEKKLTVWSYHIQHITDELLPIFLDNERYEEYMIK